MPCPSNSCLSRLICHLLIYSGAYQIMCWSRWHPGWGCSYTCTTLGYKIKRIVLWAGDKQNKSRDEILLAHADHIRCYTWVISKLWNQPWGKLFLLRKWLQFHRGFLSAILQEVTGEKSLQVSTGSEVRSGAISKSGSRFATAEASE